MVNENEVTEVTESEQEVQNQEQEVQEQKVQEQEVQEEIFEEEQPLEEPKSIQQVEGLYYYDIIYADGHLGQFTESTALAYAMGWQDNTIAQSETERGYNGWTYVKGKAPIKGLEIVKSEKLNEISAIADTFEQMKCEDMYITSSLGFRVNADRRSLQNVENMVALGESQTFKDYDNQFHYLSADELKTISHEIIVNGLNLYNQKFTMQQQIATATDYDTVANFEVEFKMMDFTE